MSLLIFVTSSASADFMAWLEVDENGKHDLCWDTKMGREYFVESSESLQNGSWQQEGSVYGWGDEVRWHVFTAENVGTGGGGGNNGGGESEDDGLERVNFWVALLPEAGGQVISWQTNGVNYRFIENTIDFTNAPTLMRWNSSSFSFLFFTAGGGNLASDYETSTYAQLPVSERLKVDEMRAAWPEIQTEIITPYVDGVYQSPPQSGGSGEGNVTGGRRFFRVREEEKDTDGDGLMDFHEFLFTKTNPFQQSQAQGGITDAQKDSDGDGASNIDEIAAGTDPLDYYNGDLNSVPGEQPKFFIQSKMGRAEKKGTRALAEGNRTRRFNKYTFTHQIDLRENWAKGGNFRNSVYTDLRKLIIDDQADTRIETNTGASASVGNDGSCFHTWKDKPDSEVNVCPANICGSGRLVNETMTLTDTKKEIRTDSVFESFDDVTCSGTVSIIERILLTEEYTDDRVIEEASQIAEMAGFGEEYNRVSDWIGGDIILSSAFPRAEVLGSQYRLKWKPTKLPFVVKWKETFTLRDGSSQELVGEFEWVHTDGTESIESEIFDIPIPNRIGIHRVEDFSVEPLGSLQILAHQVGRLGEARRIFARPTDNSDYLSFMPLNLDRDDGEDLAPMIDTDSEDLIAGSKDDDFMRLDILLHLVDFESGVVNIRMPEKTRAFDKLGRVLSTNDLIGIRLGGSGAKLTSLKDGADSIYIEALKDFTGGDVDVEYSGDFGSLTDKVTLTPLEIKAASIPYLNEDDDPLPVSGSVDGILAVWRDGARGTELKIVIELPSAFVANLPPSFITWVAEDYNTVIPDNSLEHTFSWPSHFGRKKITITFPKAGFDHEIWVDIPDVGSVSEPDAKVDLILNSDPVLLWAYAQEAREWSEAQTELSPAKRNALKHSYWCALGASDERLGKNVTLDFARAHEFTNKEKDQDNFSDTLGAYNNTMDLFNNEMGANCELSKIVSLRVSEFGFIPTKLPDKPAIQQLLLRKLSRGLLLIWDGEGSADSDKTNRFLIKSDGTRTHN